MNSIQASRLHNRGRDPLALCRGLGGADQTRLRSKEGRSNNELTQGTQPGYCDWWRNTTEVSRRAGGYSSLLHNLSLTYGTF